MNFSSFGSGSARILGLGVAACALLNQATRAGDHHPTVYLVPVQTSAAPVATVAAAPIGQYLLLQPKHSRGLVYQFAPAQSVQAVQAAAAPVAVAAAPVSYYYTMTPASAAPAPAPVAASPTKPINSIIVNGNTYVLQGTTTSGSGLVAGAAAAPDSGSLTAAQRTEVLTSLASFVKEYKALGVSDAVVKSMVRTKATSLYEEKSAGAVDTDAENKAVESLTNEALGQAPAAADASKATSTPGQQQATMMMVPAAAPVQYFLPVKVKHNLFHQYP